MGCKGFREGMNMAGQPHSLETKKKIGKSMKGKSHPQTEETKKKISKSLKGKTLGRKYPNRCRTKLNHTEATKQRMKCSQKERRLFEQDNERINEEPIEIINEDEQKWFDCGDGNADPYYLF
jgi:hypothetical protein